MPRIAFAERLRNVAPREMREYPGACLMDVLNAVGADYPLLARALA